MSLHGFLPEGFDHFASVLEAYQYPSALAARNGECDLIAYIVFLFVRREGKHGSGALVFVAFPALPVRCIDIECCSGDVSALRVFDQDEVTAPFVFGSTEGPAAAAVAEFYLFGLKQFIVLVLCEVAEVIAVVVPPPAPLDAVELHFHFSAAGYQCSFTVYIHDLHGMVLTCQQEIEGLLSVG